MSSLQITKEGIYPYSPAASGSVIYTTGDTTALTLEVWCHQSKLGEVSTDEPLIITHGIGAPLRIVVTGTVSKNFGMVSYPIK